MIESKKTTLMTKLTVHITFLAFAVLCIMPIILLISVSFTDEMTILDNGYSLIPNKVSFLAYAYIFKNPDQLLRAYCVTIIVTAIGTLLSVIIMSMTAYALSRNEFRMRRQLSMYLYIPALFNGGLVASYILMTRVLRISDTLLVLIIPLLVNIYFIFLLRTYFQKIPTAIIESAKIDGSSEFRIYSTIIIPLSKPAIATVGVFTVLTYWNEWFLSMLYIDNQKLICLQFMLVKTLMSIDFINQHMNTMPSAAQEVKNIPSEGLRTAMCLLAAGPMMFVFTFFQKYFVKGLTVGSVKG